MLTIIALVVYAGYDETLRLVRYLELRFKYAILRVRMKWMERKLRKQLLADRAEFTKSLKEFKKHGD
jgi:hypothetical protein